MSVRAARRLLWLVSVFVVPFPFFLVETGRVPVARLLQLAAAAFVMMLAEGTSGQIGTLTALLLGQAAVFLVLLWLGASVLARLAGRFSPRRRLVAVLGVVLAGVVAASFADLYRTPFRTRSLSANLLRVYE
jgi:hypothetical protein